MVLSFATGFVVKKNPGLGLLMRVSILLIKMAKHFYDTHPTAKKVKTKTTLDEQVSLLYKQQVVPNEHRLLESHETEALG